MSRCQICGRRTPVSKKEMIAHHHVRGNLCAGAGFPPIEVSDARLAEVAESARQEASRISDKLLSLYEGRANWIDPALVTSAAATATHADKLTRRLERHRAWPMRFAHQMQSQGWGDPPPAYLLSN